jgi:gas vesicle protein
MSNKTVSFVLGSLFGAAVGVVAGIMLAPRPGSESRAMAADAVNDAWDSAIDTYERGARTVNDRVNDFRPGMDAKSDELRAKVDLARERMDQLRDSLSDAVSSTTSQVSDAVNNVTDRVATMAGAAAEQNEAAAEGVHVEVVEEDKPVEESKPADEA